MGHSFPHFPKHFLDPFGGDPFKESDPFRGSAPDDFFKKQTKNDPFTSDPFTKNPSLPSKVSDAGRWRRSQSVHGACEGGRPCLPGAESGTPSSQLCSLSLRNAGHARLGGSPGAESQARSHY